MLEDVRKGAAVNWVILSELVDKKWKGSIDAFLADAAERGVTRATTRAAVTEFRGVVIGFTHATRAAFKPGLKSFALCPDLNLSLAILSHRIADIFIPSREPDFSWVKLFHSTFEVDDDSFPSATLDEVPWNAFPWNVKK